MVFRPRGVGADRRRVHERGDARLGDGAKHARRAVDIHPPEQRRIARRLDQPGEVDDGVGAAEEPDEIRLRDVCGRPIDLREVEPRPPA